MRLTTEFSHQKLMNESLARLVSLLTGMDSFDFAARFAARSGHCAQDDITYLIS